MKSIALGLALAALLAAPATAARTVATVSGTLEGVAVIEATTYRLLPDGVVGVIEGHRLAVLSIRTDSGEVARVLVVGAELLARVPGLELGGPVAVRARWGESSFRGAVPLDVDFLALRFVEVED